MTLLIAVMTAATASLGAAISGGSQDAWYAALIKPMINPPDIVFAIIWPVLFVLMGLAAILVRISAGSFNAASAALGLYFVQLAFNVSWSWVFFKFHELSLAMGILVVLWILVALTMRAFSKHSKAAMILLIPYLGWITFAGYVNASVLTLN